MANVELEYIRRSISIHPKVWKEAQEVIKTQLNMTVSKYIEIMLRTLVSSQTQTQRQLYENVAELMFKEMSPKEETKKGTKKVPKK